MMSKTTYVDDVETMTTDDGDGDGDGGDVDSPWSSTGTSHTTCDCTLRLTTPTFVRHINQTIYLKLLPPRRAQVSINTQPKTPTP